MKVSFQVGNNVPVTVIEFVDRDVNEKGKDSGPKQGKAADAEAVAA
jgi:large subunit ribosomal protein L17